MVRPTLSVYARQDNDMADKLASVRTTSNLKESLKVEVEKYLCDSIDKALKNFDGKVTTQFGEKLTEQINSGLPCNCPSAEGFRFCVWVALCEEWGQGITQGARCLWDTGRDYMVRVEKNTEKVHLSLVVFFVADTEEEN